MDDLEGRYSGARVLITGGMGFIGSNLAHRLVEMGADVTIVDSCVEGQGANPFRCIKGFISMKKIGTAAIYSE